MPERFSRPREHAKEMELHVRMRIDEFLHHPRHRMCHRDAELFLQFTAKRGGG